MDDRIALLILKINQRCKMKVIQVFGSAASYHGQEVIEIYWEIENLMTEEKRYRSPLQWGISMQS